MSTFKADLHCHSSCSDGSFSPTELIQEALKIGLTGLSITDHDTIEAYSTAVAAARKSQLPLLAGIEFSCTLEEMSVHILGYSFALAHSAISQLCQRHKKRREERNDQILANLAKLGMAVTSQEVATVSTNTVGRPHIALAMVQKGYVISIQEAFKKFLGDGRPAFAKGIPISVEETLVAIHQAGGFAIIAHPHLIDNIPILRKLLEMPFDGIEGYYARFSAESNAPWIELGQQRNWLITGGSDFHGTIKPTIPLGASWVAEETFQILFEQNAKNNP